MAANFCSVFGLFVKPKKCKGRIQFGKPPGGDASDPVQCLSELACLKQSEPFLYLGSTSIGKIMAKHAVFCINFLSIIKLKGNQLFTLPHSNCFFIT